MKKLKEKLEGFSGQSWSGLALNHVVYGANHEVAQWLAESGLTPSQVKAVYPEYGETDTWNIALDDVKSRLGNTLVKDEERPEPLLREEKRIETLAETKVRSEKKPKSKVSQTDTSLAQLEYGDTNARKIHRKKPDLETLTEPAARSNRAKSKMNQYQRSQVNWSNIWPGKVNREVVEWCCKFDQTGKWVENALHVKGAHTRRGLTNVIIARFLYCPAKVYSDTISPGTTGKVYQALSEVLENAGSTLATNIDSQQYEEFAKRVDVLYSFLNKSTESKKFINTYWRMGRNADDTNKAFKDRKVIHKNLSQLLKD